MADAKKMEWSALLKKIDLEVGKPLDVSVQKETIPIVFVPGIMGSRLKRNGKKIWDPDAKITFMLKKYGMLWVGPGDKKKALIGDGDFQPGDLEPYDDDAEHNKKFADVDEQWPDLPPAAKRGWGTVSWGTYGDVLRKLQAKDTFPAPLRALFDFPVYAVGYNWAGSNSDAGAALAKRIGEIVDDHQKRDGLCKKVIVVTHSMGGLVTRWAVEKEGAKDKVLGVVHGVQPAVGAAAAYWRMKAGFEREKKLWGLLELPNGSQWVLGTNGAEVTALLGWMPGGLQLLPGPDYTDNSGSKKWLRIYDHEGNERAAYGDDATEQIYKNADPNAYWRLVDQEWLVPDKKRIKPARAWDLFCEKADLAKALHEDLSGKQHPETQAFYGAGKEHPSCDRVEFRALVYTWKDAARDVKLAMDVVRFCIAPNPIGAAGLAFSLLQRTDWWQLRGGFRTSVETDQGEIRIELAHPYDVAKRDKDAHGLGAGDGTVSESSGKALKQRGDAVGGEKDAQAIEGIAHEPAFKPTGKSAPGEDGVVFTVAAVEKLCRDKIKKAR
jgi:pimeloyl-ACP methyl ester carboxylesterase